ncbi:MAG: site-specific integrase, partial [Gammaproteobacteria bacterium]|nr:site-specific integrase [Gammaproteobacteria bacterium]
DVAKGRDPAAERQAQRQSAITAPTFKDLADEFLKRHAIGRDPDEPNKRTWKEDQRILDTYLKSWHGRKAESITRREVIALLDDIADRAPTMANRVLACLRKVYNFGVTKDRVTNNPAHQVSPPGGAERSRDRIFDAEEIRKLWAAFDGPTGTIYRLVLTTGQRSGEVAGMTWNEIDFDSATWTVPAARMKSKRVHIVPLSGLALDMLQNVTRLDDEFVFPSPKPGQPIKNLGKAAERVKKASGIDDFRSHDLRRTCGTGMTKLGFSRFVMDRCLGHLEPGVGSRYDRHDYLGEKAAALGAWSAKLNEILTSEPMPENVVELQRAGR